MKNSIQTLILLAFIAVCFTSCEENPCEDVFCLNGGDCFEGECKCPSGYSGKNCDYYDECHGLQCENNGFCSNGSCICPTGYNGIHCQNQLTIKRVELTKLELINFPQYTESGVNWDGYPEGHELPDIFLRVYQDNNLLLTTNYYNNCHPSGTYVYDDDLPTSISSINSNMRIELWDMNGGLLGGPRLMCGYYFYLSNYKNGFPSPIELYNSNTWHQTKIHFHVNWIF